MRGWVLHEDQSQHLLPAGSEADWKKEGDVGGQSEPRLATQAGPPEHLQGTPLALSWMEWHLLQPRHTAALEARLRQEPEFEGPQFSTVPSPPPAPQPPSSSHKGGWLLTWDSEPLRSPLSSACAPPLWRGLAGDAGGGLSQGAGSLQTHLRDPGPWSVPHPPSAAVGSPVPALASRRSQTGSSSLSCRPAPQLPPGACWPRPSASIHTVATGHLDKPQP